jgi:hydroxylamine dehydrogenase
LKEGTIMKRFVLPALPFLFLWMSAAVASPPVSGATQECLSCHAEVTPGIVADWEGSLHSRVTPGEGLKKSALQRRISAEPVPKSLRETVVGCAECHTIRPDSHKDTFDHNGHAVHVVVTPLDCSTCHPEEASQYSRNLMSHAYGNLNDNPVYRDLQEEVNGALSWNGGTIGITPPSESTKADSCFSCHGTAVSVSGMRNRETTMGEMAFPVLSGWPNQGVGRINPDASKGSCSSCHARHAFSIKVARKPATCSECHKGPDVPAYAVYLVSKHGNLYSSLGDAWNFTNVPWQIGADFTAPTCAACHVSLLVSGGGEVVAARSHQMNDRHAWRIFGPVYAHPHPASPDTTGIRNRAGLPLPTELTGEPAAPHLIDSGEQKSRAARMKKVCSGCHGGSWVDGHFARFEETIRTTNAMTTTATQILLSAWENGVAKGLAHGDSIFNEPIERMWVEEWLFFANSTRFASAMGGADYGVFANGRWYLSRNIRDMREWLDIALWRKGEKNR